VELKNSLTLTIGFLNIHNNKNINQKDRDKPFDVMYHFQKVDQSSTSRSITFSHPHIYSIRYNRRPSQKTITTFEYGGTPPNKGEKYGFSIDDHVFEQFGSQRENERLTTFNSARIVTSLLTVHPIRELKFQLVGNLNLDCCSDYQDYDTRELQLE
jgi:hypothetical protein